MTVNYFIVICLGLKFFFFYITRIRVPRVQKFWYILYILLLLLYLLLYMYSIYIIRKFVTVFYTYKIYK